MVGQGLDRKNADERQAIPPPTMLFMRFLMLILSSKKMERAITVVIEAEAEYSTEIEE